MPRLVGSVTLSRTALCFFVCVRVCTREVIFREKDAGEGRERMSVRKRNRQTREKCKKLKTLKKIMNHYNFS